jgi:uncharacterized membrane protein
MFKSIKHPRFFAIPALLAVAVVVLAACASQPAATPVAQSAAPVTAVPAQATSVEANASAPAAANGAVSFSKDIAPIFQATCLSCHGGNKTEKSLDLKTYASLMAGSENGAVIVPGDAANSLLIQKVQSGNMPKRKPHLAADQIQLLVDWVNAGAQNN